MSRELFEEKCMTLISSVGVAKSNYLQVMEAAKLQNEEQIEELLKEADQLFVAAHHSHQELMTLDYKLESLAEMMLLMHAEDQLMSAETIHLLVLELLACYKRIEKLEK